MRLLLAEDERSLSRAIAVILKKNNFEVDVVYDGAEAVACLESGSYDALILDLMLPLMDGFEVIRRLRERSSRIPILVLSARTDVDDKVRALDGGANDYITKPFATRELLARIRAMTRSPAGTADSQLRLGNVHLNRANFVLSSPSGSFHLANKEFQIMELLISNPRQLISADQILEKIWGSDCDLEINVVWVYISHLRKKLASLKADIAIKATRNVGYSLEEIE